MEFLRHQPTPFCQHMAPAFERFAVVDIGCAGGLDHAWSVFGDKLAGLAFDAMADEVARLQDAETNPNVHYVAGIVVGEARDRPWWFRVPLVSWQRTFGNRPGGVPFKFPRTKDLRGMGPSKFYRDALKNRAANRRRLIASQHSANAKLENRWQVEALEIAGLSLAETLTGVGFTDFDFLKIDVDGADWEILRTLQPVLADHQVLGVAAEVNFFGTDDEDHHTFHNVDRFMRRCGFELFHLSTRRYSSPALPQQYEYSFPASSLKGRPYQGDAIYLRDFTWKTASCDPAQFSPAKHAKLAALFALFDLPDIAAEVVLRARTKLTRFVDVEAALDLLAQQVGLADSYEEHLRLFDADDPRFYPG
jgi:hypothetical protein